MTRDEKMWRVVLGLANQSKKISHSNGNETHKKFVGGVTLLATRYIGTRVWC
jgi:hypothetical protein